jgi:hypothetical protein
LEAGSASCGSGSLPDSTEQVVRPAAQRTQTDAHGGFEGCMSAVPQQQQRADTIAGFLCAFALAIAGISIVRTPGILAPVAILIGLVAARMSEAHRSLAAWTVGLSTLAFFVGMVVAISTDTRLF